ncbi:hypothetical protein BH10PLA2_BH10PLA2_06990 [soil metagenome]
MEIPRLVDLAVDVVATGGGRLHLVEACLIGPYPAA